MSNLIPISHPPSPSNEEGGCDMGIKLDIPEDQEKALRDALGDDLGRAAVEAMVIEGYRSDKLSAAEVGRILGIPDRWLVNQWLADHRVPLKYSLDDLE